MSDQRGTPPTSAEGERGEPAAPILPAPPPPTLEPAASRPTLEPADASGAQGPQPVRLKTLRFSPRVAIGAVAAVLALVLLWLLIGGSPTPERVRFETFAGRGVSFMYLSTLHRLPANDLKDLDVAQMTLSAGHADDAAWREVFAMSESDVVLLFGREQPYLVGDANIGVYESAVVARYRAEGIEPPRTRTLAVDGVAALSAVSKGTTPSGIDVQIRTTEMFAGGTAYVLACQAATGARSELMAACDAILRSVEIEPRRPTAGWRILTSRAGDVRLSVPTEWQEDGSVGRGTKVAALLPASTEGTTAMRVEVETVRLRQPVRTELYSDAVADRLKRYLIGRRSLRIDGRTAVMLRFEDKDAAGVFYVLVEGRTAYAMRFDIPIGNSSFALLQPTMDAIAGTLDLR